MAEFLRDMKKYETLIKNDLLNRNGKNNRVETEIGKGDSQYKANVMLWIACARPDISDEYCEMLIETFGADPNFVAPYGPESSCLMVASGLPNPKKVELLLKNDADPNYQSRETGYTALTIAVTARQALNCRILIFAGATTDVVFRRADPQQNIPELTLLNYANTLHDPTGLKIKEALTTYPAEVSTTMALFIDESLRQGFFNHFENIQHFYNFLNVPLPEPNVGDEHVGGSSIKRKRRRRTKRRKTNKKRKTNRRNK